MGSIMDGEATPAQIGALLARDGRPRRDRGRGGRLRPGDAGARGAAHVARAPSTPAAPAATARARSTSRPWPPSSWRPAACRWPSTATARRAAPAAARTCSRRSASASTRRPPPSRPRSTSTGWTFLFAPRFHASTRHAVGPRKEMGVRTAFNLLGPLTNPARPGRPGGGRAEGGARAVRRALPAEAGDEAGLGRERERPRRADPRRPHDRGRARRRRGPDVHGRPGGRGPRVGAPRGAARGRPAGERGPRPGGALGRSGAEARRGAAQRRRGARGRGPGPAICATASRQAAAAIDDGRALRLLDRVKEALA